MKISIIHGFHPNEYTRPYAEEVGRLLADRMYEVLVTDVPFDDTIWGAAIKNASIEELHYRMNEPSLANEDADFSFNFQAGLEEVYNKRGLAAEELEFKELFGNTIREIMWGLGLVRLGQISYVKVGTISGRYAIEIPQIFIPTSQDFRAFMRGKCKALTTCNYNDWLLNYFLRVANKSATIKKYPPSVIGKIIADGIEEKIILAHAAH